MNSKSDKTVKRLVMIIAAVIVIALVCANYINLDHVVIVMRENFDYLAHSRILYSLATRLSIGILFVCFPAKMCLNPSLLRVQ